MTVRYLESQAADDFESSNPDVGEMDSVAASFAHARRHELRYRLAVGAINPADVVRCAGGWLFDRALAGWEVTVVVSEYGDTRPLQILGADVLDLAGCLAASPYDQWPHALALDTELFQADPRVLSIVMDTLDSGRADVLLWGEVWPEELERRMGPMQHRLSSAAMAFKARACAAAAVPATPAGTVETFRTGGVWPAQPSHFGSMHNVRSLTGRVGPR